MPIPFAAVGLASAVSSDHRLSSGFCAAQTLEPGDVLMEERARVVFVAVELEDRMRRGMRQEVLDLAALATLG